MTLPSDSGASTPSERDKRPKRRLLRLPYWLLAVGALSGGAVALVPAAAAPIGTAAAVVGVAVASARRL
jgi:hypothetical protein